MNQFSQEFYKFLIVLDIIFFFGKYSLIYLGFDEVQENFLFELVIHL